MKGSLNIDLKDSRLAVRLKAVNENKMNLIVVLFLYIAGVIFHFCLSNYNKTISIYNDEMLYYVLARSIFQGNGLTVHGLNIGFTKIGYSLLIAPFFAIGNIQLRITMIMLFNSLAMMSSIFPAYFIAKELNIKRSGMYLFLLFFVLWPGLLMCETFMSEVIYFPLVLWFVLLWIKEQKAPDKILYPILEGIVCFWGYLTKEVFLSVIITYFAVSIMYPFVSALVRDRSENEGFWKTARCGYSLKRFKAAAIFLAVFVLLYIVSKVVFSGNNFYNSAYFREFSLYNLLYFFYGIIAYFAGVVISVLVFPFVYPIIMFKQTNEITRRVICFVYCNIAVCIAVISYTILLQEDLGNETLRIHLRYISPCLILIILIFLSIVSDRDKLSDYFKSHSHTAWWAIIVAVVFSFTFFKGMFWNNMRNYIDQYELGWYKIVQDCVGEIAPSNGKTMVFKAYTIILGVAFLILSVVGQLFIRRKRYERFYIGFTMILVFVTAINLYYGHEYISYGMTAKEEYCGEIQNVSNYIDNISDGDKVLYYIEDSIYKSYIDTYLDRTDNSYFVSDLFALKSVEERSISLDDAELVELIFERKYDSVEQIDYIVCAGGTSPKHFSNVEIIPEASGDVFTVFKNLDNTALYFQHNGG